MPLAISEPIELANTNSNWTDGNALISEQSNSESTRGAATSESAAAESVMSTHWLFVDGATTFGGHEVMLLRWLEELRAQRRMEPIVLARAESHLRNEVAWCAASEDLPRTDESYPRWMPRPLQSLWRAYRDAATFRRVLRRARPALCIVAEGCLLAQPVFAVVARLMNVRTIVYVPLVEPAANMGFGKGVLRDRITKWFYAKMPHAWLTITAEQGAQLKAWTQIHATVFNLPNTVTQQVEHAATQAWQHAARTLPEAQEMRAGQPVRILVLGRLDAYHKGLDMLVDFLEHAPSLPYKMHVTVMGEGPYGSELRQRMAASPQLQGLLTLRAWGNAVDLMMQHDVLLLPSRFEGVPLVMLEAMALGLPVVASDLPGTRAMLAAETLFPVGNLARAFDIIAALNDTHTRASTILRNREKFLASSSGAAFAAAVNNLTDDLLGFVRYGDWFQDHTELTAKVIGRDR